ncbi:MAG TPA: hypothetical protein VNL91_00110, partial [Thermoanaerobaculia bacterium]|nr:hypothetical protein [Thermoanaerobaculia bacterium]
AGRLLEAGVNFSVVTREISAGDRSLPRGSLVVLKGNNKADLERTLERIGGDLGVEMVPIDSGWSGTTTFGSERVRFVRDPKIGLVGGSGVSPTSFGMLWHTLDVDTPVPHTVLSLEALANLDLSRNRVLVFPDGGGYADRLGKKGTERLQQWVRDGGTIVAIKGASAYLRSKDVEISKLRPWEPPKPKEGEQPQDLRYNEFRVPGSAFRTVMNERSFLTLGLPRPPAVLVEGSEAYLPMTHKIDNILTIDSKDPLLSGVAWPESIDRLKGSPWVVSEPYGRGQVITFADDPHFRLFWRGTLPLFLNAVLYGPSFPR